VLVLVLVLGNSKFGFSKPQHLPRRNGGRWDLGTGSAANAEKAVFDINAAPSQGAYLCGKYYLHIQ
jgi:hypothetical protein